MGAFFLYKKDLNVDVKDVFQKKGFNDFSIINLGVYNLMNFQKIFIPYVNFYEDGEDKIFVYGSPIYKNIMSSKIPEVLLNDFKQYRLRLEDLHGVYSILIYHENKLHILTDQSGLYHVFSDENYNFISSSFLAVFKAIMSKKKLDLEVIAQKLLIGFDLDYRTIVKGINKINWPFYPKKCNDIVFIKPSTDYGNYHIMVNMCDADRSKCAYTMLKLLNRKIKRVSEALAGSPISIGLSGGYDSRLLFGLSLKNGLNLVPFTYVSSGHTKELQIAEQIADSFQIKLKKVEVRDRCQLEEKEIIQTLQESLFFYDGRFNKSMGGVHEIYTPAKRKNILNGTMGEINGLGGEIFRNYQNIPPKGIKTDSWILYRLIGPIGVKSFRDKNNLNVFLKAVKSSVYWAVGDKIYNFKITRRFTREFFSKVWVQGHIGLRTSVENQLSLFYTPFAEIDVQEIATELDDIIGVNGEFEALMISDLYPELAAITSTYGHSFKGIPIKHKLSYLTKYVIPDSWKLFYYLKLSNYFSKETCSPKNSIIEEIKDIFKKLDLPVNINILLQSNEHFDRVVVLGYFLLIFSGDYYI